MSVYIIAEIGGNHNGSLATAFELIKAAKSAGCDAVKFQCRTPDLAVPPEQRDVPKETPWGTMPYIEYRKRMEFGHDEYSEIDTFCKGEDIQWFASVWDVQAVKFMAQYTMPYVKIPSAKLTDHRLLRLASLDGPPTVLSTGMSTIEEITTAVRILWDPVILHCTSTYPCPLDELNLRCIPTLQAAFPEHRIGYSGHERGLAPTLAAVALGATMVERHITLDRTMWGTDQAASVEPRGFQRLVKDIRGIEAAMGDGVKKVESGEMEPMKRLRGAT
jgi:N-acetylneuraminate synthase